MPRKAWRRSEKRFIIENYAETTTEELCKHLGRDRKSVNRMIERLRDEGKIGYRDQNTVDRAYRQRKRGVKTTKRRKLSYKEDIDEV